MSRLLPVFITLVLPSSALRAQVLPDHAVFDRVLERYLHGSFVDYAGLKADAGDLEEYLASLGATDTSALANATRSDQLAFWINAYNACTLYLVISHYPIQRAGFPGSIVKSLAGVPGNSIRQISDTWTRRFCSVAGHALALDEIEHEIIRPMGEPRIHFAVNCASRSCPVLAPRAYRGTELGRQLDAAVRRFVADTAQYRFERGDPPVLRLGKVLDWYAEDFTAAGGVVEFLLPYLPADHAAALSAANPRVSHRHYDWTLNDTAIYGSQP